MRVIGKIDHYVSMDASGVTLGGPDLGADFVKLTGLR